MPYTAEIKEDFYLWHLRKIGVLNEKLESGLWDEICKQAKTCKEKDSPELVAVAIIDTGIDTGHPNLNTGDADCPRWPQIDFTPHLYGARYVPPLKSVKLYLDARALPSRLNWSLSGRPSAKSLANGARGLALILRHLGKRLRHRVPA